MKDILVHVNISPHCPARLAVAARLAKAFDARLTGAFTSATGDIPFFMMQEIAAKAEPTMRGWWMQTRDRLKAEFDNCLRGAGAAGAWIEISSDVANGIARHARCADLTIVGQIDPDELLPRPEYGIPERVALDSGGPTLLVPYKGTFADAGRRVLIAWDGSAPSARATRDALPFLKRAERVVVFTVDSGKSGAGGERPGAAVAEYLSHHGVATDLREHQADDAAVGDVILAQAAEEKADLIVMGAYGHPRAREFILGGATRTLLQRMTVPVLMSH